MISTWSTHVPMSFTITWSSTWRNKTSSPQRISRTSGCSFKPSPTARTSSYARSTASTPSCWRSGSANTAVTRKLFPFFNSRVARWKKCTMTLISSTNRCWPTTRLNQCTLISLRNWPERPTSRLSERSSLALEEKYTSKSKIAWREIERRKWAKMKLMPFLTMYTLTNKKSSERSPLS